MEKIKKEDELFLELMERAGVKALFAKKEKREVPPLDTHDPSLKIVPAPDPPAAVSNQKFSGNVPAPKIIKRKKGKSANIEPDISIDLHGETMRAALEKVKFLLKKARRYNCRTILIITGKGLNSEKEGVLKKAVWKFLNSYYKGSIDFDWAPPYLGGQGAILVSFR